MQVPPPSVTLPAGPGRAGRVGRLRVVVTVVVAAALLGGCVVRVVYNQLDWLALLYVEDYFDLDRAQEEQARQMIGRTISWHRENQLPRYATLMRTVLGGIAPPVEPAFLADRYAEVVSFWDDLLRHVAPDFARLLQSLSDEQVSDLFAKLADDNRELQEDYSGISREERRAKQDKAVIKAFKRFTGRLSPEQEALVRTRTARFHDLSDDWLKRREAWQTELRVLMAGRKTDPLFAERITDLLLNPNQFDSPGYRRLVLENQQSSFGLVAAVLNSLSPKQSGHLRNHLTTYARDFDALVRDSAGQPPDRGSGQTSNRERRDDEAS
ncbi:MAG: DUF6279 family lipoprotein [Gammaproteobacteria bacterium]|nr:DUF6279 family lipoprotein [Gammaproteobacteria bacterium]